MLGYPPYRNDLASGRIVPASWEEDTARVKALGDLTILDLSRVLAGPFCTQVLSDLGATVWKIESPRGDDTRRLGPPFIETESSYYLSINRGKKSVCVNLKDPRGQSLVQRMAQTADVVVENFKTGDLARYGLDYQSIERVNPKIVYASITGYGHTGPRANEPGVDTSLQGMIGLMSVTGEPDRPPSKVGVAMIDLLTGLLSAAGIMAALIERDKSGHGQHIDLSLFDTGIMGMVNVAQNYIATGNPPERYGSAHPQICPYQAFEAKDGRWFMLAVMNDGMFRKLGPLIDRPGIHEDPRFETNAARLAHSSDLLPILVERFSTKRRSEWIAMLNESGITAAPINTFDETLQDPQAAARRVVWNVQHPTIGELPLMANALQYMSRTPAAPQGPPPLLGEHTREVLSQFLSAEELDDYERAGVVGPAVR